jgi:hypothetical protein
MLHLVLKSFIKSRLKGEKREICFYYSLYSVLTGMKGTQSERRKFFL